MIKLLKFKFFLSIITATMLSLVFLPDDCHAQNPFPADYKIFIWNTNIFLTGQQNVYKFYTYHQGNLMNSKGNVTDIRIHTNQGDIEFEGECDGSNSTRYIEGTLITDSGDIISLEILGGTGIYNNQKINLSPYIEPIRFIPLRLTMKKDGRAQRETDERVWPLW